jgi:hypothetical protein
MKAAPVKGTTVKAAPVKGMAKPASMNGNGKTAQAPVKTQTIY